MPQPPSPTPPTPPRPKATHKAAALPQPALTGEVVLAGEGATCVALDLSVNLAKMIGEGVERFGPDERRWIVKAYALANHLHMGVKRQSGDPYITHPVAVARTLLTMGLDWQTLCAGLLHDTIEDTPVTHQELRDAFPDPIADLVMGVTNISSVNFHSTHEEQVENLRKMILAMARDIRVILIKLADRLHNMQTLQFLSVLKQRQISRSTMEIYAPLAGRLGIYWIKSELEDLGMSYLYPKAYRELADKMEMKKRDRVRQVENSIRLLDAALREHDIEAELSGRPKHFWSIYNKMRGQDRSFEEIYDLNALRVICDSTKRCYEILGIIHSIWKPVPEHFADYIALPKANGYQSIHTKVIGPDGRLTEIQIRTREMHRTAEEGIAAHWSYKEGKRVTAESQEKLSWLRQMVAWIQEANDPTELLYDLKREAFADKVYCFTPKGDVIEMPAGATILDFAYRIHTDLGHRCTGGKINDRFVPLRSEVKNGDIVEIVASKTPHPSSDWLKVAATSRARAKIRHALKLRDYDKNVQLGHDMIVRSLAKAGIHVSAQELRDALEPHLHRHHVQSVDDLFAEVGFGSIPSTIVVARFLPAPPAPPPPPKRGVKAGHGAMTESVVLVDGMPGSLTRFAQCCRPQPGDPISGFVTRGRGISIHLRDCPHLDAWLVQSPDNLRRFVPVTWSHSAEEEYREIGVRITAEDRTGILADLTRVISQMDIVITASKTHADQRTHRAIMRFTVMVREDGQWNALLTRLREIPEVLDVTRDSRLR